MQDDPGKANLRDLHRLMRSYFADAAKLQQSPRRRFRVNLAARLTLVLIATYILLYFAVRAGLRP